MSQDIRCTEGNVVACVPEYPDDDHGQKDLDKIPGRYVKDVPSGKPYPLKHGLDQYTAGAGYTLGSLVGSTQRASKNVWSYDISNTAHDGFEVGNNYNPPQLSNFVPMYNDGDKPDRSDRGGKGDKGDKGGRGDKGHGNGNKVGSDNKVDVHIDKVEIGGCGLVRDK